MHCSACLDCWIGNAWEDEAGRLEGYAAGWAVQSRQQGRGVAAKAHAEGC